MTDIDLVISRIVDQAGTPADYSSLEIAAAQEPKVWTELSHALRLNQALQAAVKHHTRCPQSASLTDVLAENPTESSLATSQASPLHTLHLNESHRDPPASWDEPTRLHLRRLGVVRSWGGWIAAALIVAVIGQSQLHSSGEGSASKAGLSVPTDYLAEYLSTGRKAGTVVGEMPNKILLNTVPAEDGSGMYVLYLRQIVERVKVDDLYRISVDELGKPIPTRPPSPPSPPTNTSTQTPM